MSTALLWFRKDLRLTDNPALYEACKKHEKVIPLYIFDGKNSVLGEAQSWWLHHSLCALKDSLRKKLNLALILRKGNPLEIIETLAESFSIAALYWNRCYEPSNIEHDKNIKARLNSNIEVYSFNASLFNEPWTISNKNGDFFKVFTPYWKTIRQTLFSKPITELGHRPKNVNIQSEELKDWKLLPSINWAVQFPKIWNPGEIGAQQKLDEFIRDRLHGYKNTRDIPEKQATSCLSPHLHFGEISVWDILRAIESAVHEPGCDLDSAERFLTELGWREFSYYLLYHFPSLAYKNFKNEFDNFPWDNNQDLLRSWQKGMTGYPIVDAGMRELWSTGYMHNRVRMIVASFLTKDLFIDWRVGADWFLDTLVDADLANNSASWQWVAGSGVDASPYFRIFNPVLQSQKFDPQGLYIRRWIPELNSLQSNEIHAPWEVNKKLTYPKPIVNHKEARSKALAYYKQLKK